jgi:hypothetical protein
MKNAILIVSMVLLAHLFGLLISVGLFWILRELINAGFGTGFAFSAWIGGAMLYVVSVILKQ